MSSFVSFFSFIIVSFTCINYMILIYNCDFYNLILIESFTCINYMILNCILIYNLDSSDTVFLK